MAALIHGSALHAVCIGNKKYRTYQYCQTLHDEILIMECDNQKWPRLVGQCFRFYK